MAKTKNSAEGAESSTDEKGATEESTPEGASKESPGAEDAAAAPAEKRARVRLHVLKPFKFLYPATQVGTRMVGGSERVFGKGDHELDPDDPQDRTFLEHPWIRTHLADGHIEHPQKTLERLKVATEKAEADAARNRAAIAEAQAQLERHAFQDEKTKGQSDAFLREMNTPINQLR